jgi:hypothetical protein
MICDPNLKDSLRLSGALASHSSMAIVGPGSQRTGQKFVCKTDYAVRRHGRFGSGHITGSHGTPPGPQAIGPRSATRARLRSDWSTQPPQTQAGVTAGRREAATVTRASSAAPPGPGPPRPPLSPARRGPAGRPRRPAGPRATAAPGLPQAREAS